MSTDAVARERLRDRLGEVLGPAEAATLMAVLPEHGDEAATTAHLDDRVGVLRAEMATQGDQLRAEMATQGDQLRAEMATQGDQLRAEMATQGDQLRAEMAAQGDQLRTEMIALRHELVGVFRGELMAAVTSQTRTIVYANLGLVLGSVSLALAAGRLMG